MANMTRKQNAAYGLQATGESALRSRKPGACSNRYASNLATTFPPMSVNR